jgi:signal peptidase II
MSLATRRITGLALAGAIYWVDQWLKMYVVWDLGLRRIGRIELLPFFNLTYAENYGVSLGMLTAQSVEMRWLLVTLTGLIAIGVLVWMLREKTWADILSLAMVLGGAAGNIRDRAGRGFVIDYADFHIGDFHPFIFNLADAAITVGVAIILARSLLSREKPETAATKTAAGAAPES